MREYIEIGASPCNEDCAQLGTDDYYERAMKECKRFIEVIRQALGPEPEGAQLRIKGSSHDYGRYYEVACYYEDTNKAAIDYAFRCESEAPTEWPTPNGWDAVEA